MGALYVSFCLSPDGCPWVHTHTQQDTHLGNISASQEAFVKDAQHSANSPQG